MTALAEALTDYLTMRRALGFKLDRTGQLLADFVAHAERVGATCVTVELAVGWATGPVGADPGWHAARLSAVRGFTRYLVTLNRPPRFHPPMCCPADHEERRRICIPMPKSPR
jgi:integrase/recombinase XerD